MPFSVSGHSCSFTYLSAIHFLPIPLFSASPMNRTRKHLNVSGIFCLQQATQRKRVDIVDENLSTRYTEDGCGVLVRQRTTTTRSLATE